MKEEISIETISPDQAMDYLKASKTIGTSASRFKRNRPIKPRILAKLKQDLLNDDWRFDGSTICFDGRGKVIDGQHRLRACAETGVEIKTAVVRGIEAVKAAETKDTGVGRTVPDVLYMAEEKSCATLSATLNKVHMWERGIFNPHSGASARLTNLTALDYLCKHPGIRDACRLIAIGNPKLTTLVNASTAAALHYLISDYDELLADAFWEQVATGKHIGPGDPTYVLRQSMIKDKMKDRLSRMPLETATALLIKSWNAFVEGKEIKVLRWKDGERFPPLLYPRLSEFFSPVG